ncbi:Pyruvate formate lyase activating enzyme [Desulfatibacillum aliphaticivorans]|uniref:Pyruvate formate lyase activating enzyme n=1 Tax=Desulfatibacillum aliphaticivorans TaxID=218208 RepID=B8FMK6_DESAL|nr:glycyl-radical enzyme activating protein [Desulfatibacillum aliphaticivorans]ACL01873.1 Pyruvate formate lyase activating enzyme [Desulfatibacillum aliphaticivorans]
MQGRIFSIQRMSTEDGPGIRTTVFLKGCSLSCTWCHNPESISALPQVQWIGSRCIGCRSCVEVCPHNALELTQEGMQIDRGLCEGCGRCADECPSTAMEMLGEDRTLEDLAAELEKDRAYFESSGGGVTISGGEPALQADFAASLLRICQGKGLHTALDTCGMVKPAALESILPFANMVLFDVKFADTSLHKRFTGAPNDQILKNLALVAEYMQGHENPRELWIRTPLIPGATAAKENIVNIGRFLANNLGQAFSRWELCAFNNLCKDKYTRLGKEWDFAEIPLMTQEEVSALESAARESGVNPEIVFATGATRSGD